MPNKKSAIKRVRQSEKRRIHNRAKRSSVRTAVKKVERAIEAGEMENLDAKMVAAQSKLAKAAKTKLIKKKAMSRKQSRLARAANKLKAAGASE